MAQKQLENLELTLKSQSDCIEHLNGQMMDKDEQIDNLRRQLSEMVVVTHKVKMQEMTTAEAHSFASQDIERLSSTIDTMLVEMQDLRTKDLLLRRESVDNRTKANEALNNLSITEF